MFVRAASFAVVDQSIIVYAVVGSAPANVRINSLFKCKLSNKEVKRTREGGRESDGNWSDKKVESVP